METLTESIQTMDDAQLAEVIRAVMRRYDQLYPEWDACFLTLPKDPKERKQALGNLFSFLENGYARISAKHS